MNIHNHNTGFFLVKACLLISILVIFSQDLESQSAVYDTLTWRKEGASEIVNFPYFNHGDSALVWLQPAAVCSLIAIRFKVIDWEGNMLLDIWDGSNYYPFIYSKDSTDANGWIGVNAEWIEGAWIPGDVILHSPLGWNVTDPAHHFWGPFPYTVTTAHAEHWIETPASLGIQGKVDLRDEPFFIGAAFFPTGGGGFYAQDPYPGSTPYNLFTCHRGLGPGGLYQGWFIRSHHLWFEAVVRYYENTPPVSTDMTVQNYTYAPGPFPISALITDNDAENSANAGVARAYLVYSINGITDSTRMDGPCTGGEFMGMIPSISKHDTVEYYISAYDPHKLRSRSRPVTFARIEPEHPGADYLVILDGKHSADIDTFFDVLFSHIDFQYHRITFELWDISKYNGIDASVMNYGWNTIYVSGWKCEKTIPGQNYFPNLFAEWLEQGTTEAPHNLLYIDQDYFCAHSEYGCDWDGELEEGDFLYDYFNVTGAVSNNHGSNKGGYDSVAVGKIGSDFEEIEILFRPNAWDGLSLRNDLFPDWIIDVGPDAELILNYRDSGHGAGVRMDREYYRAVYIPWPEFFASDTLENGQNAPRTELIEFMRMVLEWMGPYIDPPYPPPPIVEVETGEVDNHVIDVFLLYPNYPNPFNSTTDIRYQIVDGRSFPTTVKIINILGQEVRMLVNEVQEAGAYSIRWDGTDEWGMPVGSGVYFYQLKSGDFVETKRMLLLK